MSSYIRAQASYWRAKAARFRELTVGAEPGVASELLKLADGLDAYAAEVEACPTPISSTTLVKAEGEIRAHLLLDAVRDEGNRHFIAAWQRWCGPGRLLPKRSEVELGDIKELLGHVVLLELISEENVQIKVAGSQLREHSGFETTGKNFRDLTPIDQWPLRRWRMNQVATVPCGARQVNINRWTRDGRSVALETVTLPLEPDDPAKPRMLISNVAALSGVYDAPAKDRPRLASMPDEFRFLDLAAGIPRRITP